MASQETMQMGLLLLWGLKAAASLSSAELWEQVYTNNCLAKCASTMHSTPQEYTVLPDQARVSGN